ncbi:MAG TPA: hypothetical protein VGD55_05335 [Acidothermaceae bacterium]
MGDALLAGVAFDPEPDVTATLDAAAVSWATLGPAELGLHPVAPSTRHAAAVAINVNLDFESIATLGFLLYRSVALAGSGVVRQKW